MNEFIKRIMVKFVGLCVIAILAMPWICGHDKIMSIMSAPVTKETAWFFIPLFGGLFLLSTAITLVLYTKDYI